MHERLKSVGVLATCALALPLWAPGAALAEYAPVTDSKSEGVLRSATRYLQGLKSFRLNVHSVVTIEAGAVKQTKKSVHTLILERPRRLALRRQEGETGATIVCDGKNIYVHHTIARQYVVGPNPESVDGLPGGGSRFAAVATGMAYMPFVDMLLRKDPYAAIMDGVRRVEYVGREKLDEVECHRLRFDHPEFGWDMWIEAGDRPLVRKVVPDVKTLFAKMAAGPPGGRPPNAKAEITFDNWKVDIELPDDAFKFEPPDGVVRADMPEQSSKRPHPLVGKQAPDFKLALLDGQPADLKGHRGKRIVILEFWASWCAPCATALRTTTDVTRAFEKDGVVLVTVNQRENPKTVTAYLKKQKLSCSVALDKDGAVCRSYGGSSIPRTIIIDKSGVVRAVFEGLTPNMRAEMKQTIESLVGSGSRGKDRG